MNVLSIALIATSPFILLVTAGVGLAGPLASFTAAVVGMVCSITLGVIAVRGLSNSLPTFYSDVRDYFYPPKKSRVSD